MVSQQQSQQIWNQPTFLEKLEKLQIFFLQTKKAKKFVEFLIDKVPFNRINLSLDTLKKIDSNLLF